METRERTLVIGAGEIGLSLGEVLSSAYDVSYKDKDKEAEGQFDVINICIPHSKNFLDIVREYTARYKPKLVIIHSSVPVGTTKKLGKGFVHSPVNGKHPNLANSIRTFIKVIGGNNGYDTFATVQYLQKAGIRTQVFSSSDTSELAKISCTSIQYALSIIAMKEIVRLCEKHNVPFHEVYTEWNMVYNECVDPMFKRPTLFPKKGDIGGHCVINNAYLLDDPIADFVLQKNESYKNVLSKKKKGGV